MGIWQFDKPNFDHILERLEKKKKLTNQTYAKAMEVAKITGEDPKRWLRAVKNYPVAIQRALDNLNELQPRNKAAYFRFLFKKFKNDC